MKYFGELLAQWRPLLAALIGMGSALSVASYVNSITAPQMIAEFHWTPAAFAQVSTLLVLTGFAYPLAGRLADIIGVRRTALLGVIAYPLGCLGYAAMNGDMRVYIAVFLLQSIFSVPTTATVYTRIVVQYVEKARGLALAVVAAGPPLVGGLGAKVFNDFVEAHGWREGYIAFAAFSAIAGAVALLLMPSDRKPAVAAKRPPPRNARKDYAEIIRKPAFWVMLAALLLCNLPQIIMLNQLKLVLMENGISATGAAAMFSAMAGGMLVGRFASGLALDRFPAHLVAAIGLGAPCVGLFLIASSWDAPAVLTVAVFVFALSYGAEGDVMGYLVVRNFGVEVFSSVMGLMTFGIIVSASLGAAVLSATLAETGSYALFVLICAFAVLIGGALFLMLKGRAPQISAQAAASEAT